MEWMLANMNSYRKKRKTNQEETDANLMEMTANQEHLKEEMLAIMKASQEK
jgi:hypothetical protein